ncbi:SLC13 family permease [Marimonas arenosa]|uniref:SLC13 family permease n=1 Tax=Marimonas arenosa TaxID=1795305 RepID=A0AAE3WG87_9RHOB|nr:SLC13 family permease [Marimonas arenosa]MDQ2091187.1 SLC13 family permease [Marimonas arenosa]
MTVEIIIVLALLALAIVFFAMEWLPVDIITLSLLVALVVSGILTPAEAFSGFANEMVIILASVFVLSSAMLKSGVMDWLSDSIRRYGGRTETRAKGILLTITAATSAFLSNTVATAMLMPAVLRIARDAEASPSRFLMPVAYASILGGACTLIGTSTNIAGSAMAAQLGLQPFSMFEFLGIGLLMATSGIVWLVFFSNRLTPAHAPVEPGEEIGAQAYLSALVVPEGSRAEGRAIGALKLGTIGVTALSVVRAGKRLNPHHRRKLAGGDLLIVRAPRESLLRAEADLGLAIDASQHFSDRDVEHDEIAMAEAVLLAQSNLVGRTLKQLDFHRRYGVRVVAIHRPGHARPAKIENMRLQVGDVLLVQGAQQDLESLRGNRNLWGLLEVESRVLTHRQGAITVGTVLTAVMLGAWGVLPLSITLLSAAIALVMARFVTMEEAYRFIEWRLLVLIAGLTSFGGAMIETGAAMFLAELIVGVTLPFGVTVSMAAFALLTVLLTQPMSNAAAALTVIPVAAASAETLGVDARALVILVTLSASLSFITPLEPACLLVYGPGRYHFRDFVRAGLPLTVICLTLLLIFLPVFWPL